MLHNGGLTKLVNWLAGRFEHDHGLTVHADGNDDVSDLSEHMRGFLYQSIRELLFNVVKHAGVKEAWLRIAADGDTLTVTVEDHGQGFVDAASEHPSADAEHFGLFAIRQRVSFLNGSLTLKSDKGRGTCVRITLPLERAAPESHDPRREGGAASAALLDAATDANQRRIRVLLVDDHEMLRKGLRSLLEGHAGIEVVGEASDGAEAVQLASELHPDVAVMDLTLPRMDGVEATRLIVAGVPGTQVIGLSMHESNEKARAIRDAGAVAYLNKAGPPEQLVAAIRATRATGNTLAENGDVVCQIAS